MAARKKLKAGAVRRGRPSIHSEAWSKVSVVLMDRQIARLDSVVASSRRTHGNAITRAALIRAVVDGVMRGGVDLAAARSEGELVSRLIKRLQKRTVRN